MREKELRLALVCYGGISLAVYMHGVTKEVWHLVRASRDFHDETGSGTARASGSEPVYRRLLETIEQQAGLKLRVLNDIVAGASAGGINGVFLAQAIVTGQSLDPLTDLWLDRADVEILLDPDAQPLSRFTKFWAQPLVWMAAGRSGTIDETVDAETRGEVRAKLSRFVRARWFAPPFGGKGFDGLLLDALDAMEATERGPGLLPPGQPLDLFVTVTDFRGHPQKLRLHSPSEVIETEHRLTIGFSTGAQPAGHLADHAELAFAARSTASFPGAFPPFMVGELDDVLKERRRAWPGRDAFLARVLPHHAAAGTAAEAVLIDGSVLANAPFRPAIEALKNRPARRELDRRFVYVDPKPGLRSINVGSKANEAPGFFTTILGALSDIPREQPIRDNLETIEQRSQRIARTRRIVEALRPEVEAAIETLFGMTFFLDRPTASRLAGWRSKAQDKAAKQAGHAYAAYGHLKVAAVVDEIALLFARFGTGGHEAADGFRPRIWAAVSALGLDRVSEAGSGATEGVILFFRSHDLGFRIRRLRTLARQFTPIEEMADSPSRTEMTAMRDAIYDCLALYLDREIHDFYAPDLRAAAANPDEDMIGLLDRLAAARDLKRIDLVADDRIAEALAGLPKAARRTMLLAYLGFPFYDLATLPLLQGEGMEEFDPVKVDRISPEDAVAIRGGGVEATLKGIQFNSFGAFFSRAYRENDYLWGRLHGADRLIDIVISTVPPGHAIGPDAVAEVKRAAFLAIVEEEAPRLKAVPELIESLRDEIG